VRVLGNRNLQAAKQCTAVEHVDVAEEVHDERVGRVRQQLVGGGDLGQVAEVVTTGQRVLPRKALSLGYRFKFPEIEAAEYVTWKQRQLDIGSPIGPSPSMTVAGYVGFVPLVSQRSSRCFFELEFCPETVPQESGRSERGKCFS
jgi:hypothetical protein